ncbi:MAG TPA: IPT/TIG domain-containing protein [Vicinamibacterales bacterium]|nr:IPT/TIG domain-containing protein [Vicinamibacterales bacterium]
MAISFQRVQPGDLITADLMNQIMSAIETLDGKVGSSTTTGTKAVITGYEPAGAVRPGDQLTIHGQNFGSQPSLDVVTINGVRVDIQAGSSDQQLIVIVPAISNIPAQGLYADLTLSTANGFVKDSIFIVQQTTMPLTGLITVTLSPKSTTDPLDSDGSYSIVYKLLAETTADATYTIQAGIDQAGWSVTAPANMQIPTSTSPGSTFEVPVQLSIPKAATNGTKAVLSFTITASNNPGFSFGLSTNITVGQTLTVPSDAITVSLYKVFPPGKNVSSTIVADKTKPGQKFGAHFIATTKTPGNYTIATPKVNNDPTNKWTVTVNMSSADFPTTTANQQTIIITEVTAQSGATDAEVDITVSSKDTSDTFTLQQPLSMA